MDQERLTYSVTSLAPPNVNALFQQAKNHFYLFIDQEKTQVVSYILKNEAHITLKGMFYLQDPAAERELVQKLQTVSFQPIPIFSEDLDIYVSPNHGNILVIKVKKTPMLQQLHSAIIETIKPFTTDEVAHHEGEDFTPHLSVLYYLPEDKKAEALSYATTHILPINYTLNSFLLMKDVPGVKKERAVVATYQAF